MITLLEKSSYKESFWKNGKGKTFQIAIFPEHASVAANDFLWRISSARVCQDDSFSIFPDCERQLVVWKGDGLLLNDRPLLPNSPHLFSGEENIFCKLINNTPVVDLGIIYKRDLIKASLVVLEINAPTQIEFTSGVHFLFFANGEHCLLNEFAPKIGDCLKIENENNLILSINSDGPLIFYQFSLRPI